MHNARADGHSWHQITQALATSPDQTRRFDPGSPVAGSKWPYDWLARPSSQLHNRAACPPLHVNPYLALHASSYADRAVSRFLAYLDDVGAADLAVLGVRDLSGFLLRQRRLRRKTIASMRSCLADFLDFLATAGRTPRSLADRLPPQKYVRHESEPHLWTADEVRRTLAGIDRQSATGKRDYAMILATARLGLRISDLRHLELGDLDWRAKTITIIQHKTGRPLSLPLLDDVGWAVIDYVKHGRPVTVCPKVFVKHRHPFDTFGCASSVASRLSRHAARAGIDFPPDKVCGMHSLRGALAVAMIGNDTPIPVVSAVLGHASSDTTQAYYLRFDTERLRCCALDVEDVIEKAATGGERNA